LKLPVTIQFMLALIAYAINERMARRLEYLQEEVRVLKETLATATGNSRIPVHRRAAPTPCHQGQGTDARGA
jgi:hypothetical protein